MTEDEWTSGPIADLLLHTLDIHRARHGAEPNDSAVLQPPTAALRCDLGRKHMPLAFAVVRRYWTSLAPAARRTITAWEAVEEGERERDPLGDDYVEFLNTLIACENAVKGDTALALWLVTGWWNGVKTELEGKELPADWRPLFHDVFGDAFCQVLLQAAHRTPTIVSLARAAYDDRHLPSGELDLRGWPCWPTPLRRPVPPPNLWRTSAHLARTFAAVLRSICAWAGVEHTTWFPVFRGLGAIGAVVPILAQGLF